MADRTFLKNIRDENTTLLVKTLIKKNSLSRLELSNECELAPGTITQLVTPLMEAGIVEEYKTGDSSGGRKPVYLRITPDFGCVVSFAIQRDGLTGAVYNLQGDKKEEEVISRKLLLGNGLFNAMAGFIKKILNGGTVHPKRIIYISILCQEDIQDSDLSVLFATNVASDVIPLEMALLSKFGIPVHKEWIARFSLDYYVQNETKARYQNYGYINIGDTVTASFTVNRIPVEINGEKIFNLTSFLSDKVLMDNSDLIAHTNRKGPRSIVKTAEEERARYARSKLGFSVPGIAKIIRSANVFFPMEVIFLGGEKIEDDNIQYDLSKILKGKPKVRRYDYQRDNLMDIYVHKSRDRFVAPLLSGVAGF